MKNQKVYIHTKFTSMPVAWALGKGVIISPSELKEKGAVPVAFYLMRLLKERDWIRLEKELAMEKFRRENFPNLPSRLNSFYAFSTKEACKIAQRIWNGVEGDYFNDDSLIEVGVSPTKISSHDTAWVDKHVVYSEEPLGEDLDWIEKYWTGETFPGKSYFEVLIEGTGIYWNQEVQRKAFQIVDEAQPYSTVLLHTAMTATSLAIGVFDRIGHFPELINYGCTSPLLIVKNAVVNIVYCMKEQFMKDEKFLSLLVEVEKEYPEFKNTFFKGEIKFPDLREYNLSIPFNDVPKNIFRELDIFFQSHVS